MKYITLEKDPNIIINKKLEYFYNPDYIYIPISSKLDVREGSLIFKDMPIGKYYSSVSGQVLGASKQLVNGKLTSCLVVTNDFREKCPKIKKKKVNIDILTILKSLSIYDEDLFNKFKSLKQVDNIVINAIDDEVYVTNNIINFKENINDVLEFLDKLTVLYKCLESIIVIKNTESDLIEECLDIIGSYSLVKLTLMEDIHLLGRKENVLEKLNKDINKTLYLTMDELVKLEKIVNYGLIDSTKVLTICGDEIKTSKVIIVKKYTLLKDILDKYIKFKDNDYVIIVNSLLNGYVAHENLVITDDIKVIYIMKKRKEEEQNCIRCGKCLNVCPKNIDIVKHLKSKKNSKLCVECGLCNYICPSHINIIKYLKEEE